MQPDQDAEVRAHTLFYYRPIKIAVKVQIAIKGKGIFANFI